MSILSSKSIRRVPPHPQSIVFLFIRCTEFSSHSESGPLLKILSCILHFKNYSSAETPAWDFPSFIPWGVSLQLPGSWGLLGTPFPVALHHLVAGDPSRSPVYGTGTAAYPGSGRVGERRCVSLQPTSSPCLFLTLPIGKGLWHHKLYNPEDSVCTYL